jgi:aspartate aminotransferase
MLANRTLSFSTSGTASARAGAQAAAAAGQEIIDLTAGEIIADLGPTLRAGAMTAIERGVNRYTDTIGLPELRHVIARKLSATTCQPWHMEEIALTAGAKQALFNAAMVVLDPGDEVIIPAPYWTTFPAQVALAGGRCVFVDTRSNGFIPRVEDIRNALTSKTRAIIVNTPGNPTGAVYDRATLEGIADLALTHDIWVIFDECYGTFTYEPSVHEHLVSVAPQIRPRALIVNSFSKQLAITGWRVGYLGAPKDVIKAVKALQSHTTSNPNVIGQHAVLAHLQRAEDGHEHRLREQLNAGRSLGLNILSTLEHVPKPVAQGGFYFYLDLTELNRPADEVASLLLSRAGVACVSGSAFGDPHGLRLSYGLPHELLERGLRRLVDTLNALT